MRDPRHDDHADRDAVPGGPGTDDVYAPAGVSAEGGQPLAGEIVERVARGPAAPEGGPVAEESDAEQLLADQRDKYLRLAAEYDNFRKRTAKERLDAGARAQAQIVAEMVDALDDLGRFAHLDPDSVDAKTVVHGVELVERKMLKALGAAGLLVVNPVDQPFDPAHHEAVGTEAALSPEDDHVVARVYQQGYLFNGQLLRPARVVVKQWVG